jgi:hypothetical protein
MNSFEFIGKKMKNKFVKLAKFETFTSIKSMTFLKNI